MARPAPLAPNARGEPPRPEAGTRMPKATIGAVGSTALFGQAPASCAPDSGAPRVA